MSRGGSAECQPLMDAALCGIAVGCTQLASCGIFVISTSLPIRSLALGCASESPLILGGGL